MKIIVTGSWGNIGRPLTEILVKQGHAVTVVSSDPKKQVLFRRDRRVIIQTKLDPAVILLFLNFDALVKTFRASNDYQSSPFANRDV
jgi:nucleoside-diphosphate-sugar epimerase